jgi:hypothetical protein
MTIRRFVLTLTMGFLSGLPLSCVGPTFIVQQYAGPVRPQETVAVFRINGGDSIRLVTIDDENITVPLASDSRLHVEMLPGRHAITVRDAHAPDRLAESIAFQAEAGKVYRVAVAGASTDPAGGGPRIYEVDRGADTITRDVTLTPGELQHAPTDTTPAGRTAAPSGDAGDALDGG